MDMGGGVDTESDFSVQEGAMIVMGAGWKQVDRLSKFRWTWGGGGGGHFESDVNVKEGARLVTGGSRGTGQVSSSGQG